MKRAEKNEDIKKAINLLRESRIFVSTGNILQLPGQCIEEAVEMADFYNENRVDQPRVYFLRYYPRTEICEMARREGLLTQEAIDRMEDPETDGSFMLASRHDDKDFLRVRTLIQLTAILPKSWVRALIRRDRWRYIPAIKTFHALEVLGYSLKRVRGGKRRFVENYTTTLFFLLMCIYGLKKLGWRIRHAFRPKPRPPTKEISQDRAITSAK